MSAAGTYQLIWEHVSTNAITDVRPAFGAGNGVKNLYATKRAVSDIGISYKRTALALNFLNALGVFLQLSKLIKQFYPRGDFFRLTGKLL